MTTSGQNPSSSSGRWNYLLSLAMLGALFFVFGLVSWVNSILIPYFKVACELKSGVQTYLVTFAFNIAYLVMTIPAAFLLRRTGYKKGATIGLWIMAAGALLFWPAALTRTYGLFLLALFTIGTALAILQSVANPFVTIIGPYESAAKRISVMGICNKLAGILAPLIFAAIVIRPQDKVVMDQVEAGLLTGAAKDAALDGLVRGVILPYAVLAVLLFIFGIIFYKSPVQDINPDTSNSSGSSEGDRKSVWKYPYLVLGVLALFCHLGSQQKSLVVCTITGLVLSTLVLVLPPKASIWSLVLLGIPNSLIYAGIWPLAIRGLGRWTSLGSCLLVMALCGNAILPLLYGAASDHMSLQAAYWLLIPCFAYMIFYAVYGYKIEKW